MKKVKGTDLFIAVKMPNAMPLFDALCRQKIYVRLCDEGDSLRFGIPDEAGLQQLATAFRSKNVQKRLACF